MFFKYAKTMSERARRERDLIQRVQLSDDRLAMRELMQSYQGVMNDVVNKSGVTYKTGISQETAMVECEKIFKNIIKNKFDLNKDNQPNTYIINNLANEFKHYIDANYEPIVRKSSQQSMISRQIGNAEGWMDSLGIEKTPQNVESFIRKNFGLGGNYLDAKSIETTRNKDRKELSGDRDIAGAASGMEDSPITLSDLVSSKQRPSGESVFREMMLRQEIEKTIKKPIFSRQERQFIRQLAGLGEFANTPQTNINRAAVNAGLTYSQGKSVIRKLRNEMGTNI